MMSPVTRWTSVLLIGLLCATLALAQTSTGSISGTVTDPNGAVVAEAKIQAQNVTTGTTLESVTNEVGLYVFPSVQPGEYRLTAEKQGFKKLIRSNINVLVGTRVNLDLPLEVGYVQETIEVKAETPMLESTTVEMGANLPPVMMDKLPLYNGGLRNAENFIQFMPGYTAGGEVSISGSGGRSKEILIDGGSIISPESGGMSMRNIGAEAFREFKMTTGSYSAELGRFGGGVETFVPKAGTNDIHGSGFWNLKRDILNAAGWTSNAVLGREPGFRAKTRLNEQGGAVGGPVYIPKLYDGRNRTFFYFTYTRDAEPAAASYSTYQIPTAAMQSGNFTGSSYTIYDPTTGQPFAGNTIPTTRMSSRSKAMLSAIPTANSGSNGDRGLYTVRNFSEYVATIWSIKADHNITANDRVSYYFQRYDDTTAAATGLPGALNQVTDTVNRMDAHRVNHDHVFTPTMLLHTMFAYSKTTAGWDDPLQRGYGSKFGFGTTGDADATPTITFGNGQELVGWGSSSGKVGNGGQWNITYQLTPSLSWIKGKHEIKIGFDLRKLQTNNHDLAGANGSYTFSNLQTADASGRNGSTFASFLLGLPNSASVLYSPTPDGNIRYAYYAGWIQDNYRVTDRLTLNLGFRYEVPRGWNIAGGNYSTIDLKAGNPAAGGRPGALIFAGDGTGRTGKQYLYSTDYSNIGPRVGAAYRLGNKTVLRGGAGVFYVPLGNAGCDTSGCAWGFSYKNSVTASGTSSAFNWDDGIPYPSGFVAPPNTSPAYANGQTVYVMGDGYGKAPRMVNWSFSIQQEFKNFVTEIAYVGNRGYGLNNLRNLNQLPTEYLSKYGSALTAKLGTPAANAVGVTAPYAGFNDQWSKTGNNTVAQALRLYPQYGNVYDLNSGDGLSWYDSLQMKIERRFGSLVLNANYTFSKSEMSNYYRTIFGSTTYISQDAYNMADAKSLSPFDQKHAVNILTSYDLPFGKGKRLFTGAGRLLNGIINDWSISGTQRYNTGVPLRVANYTNYLASEIFSTIQKSNATGQGFRTSVNRGDVLPNSNAYYNVGAFSAAPAYTLGTSAFYYDSLRNAPNFTENAGVMKRFTLYERFRFQYRADIFNIFNRTCFGGFNTTINLPINTSFGKASGPQQGGRTITMGLRLEF